MLSLYKKMRNKNESGSVIVSVIILFVLLSVILSMILMVTITSINNTETIKKTMEAQTNSDSAIDIAIEALDAKSCLISAPVANLVQSSEEASNGIYYNVTINWSTKEDASTSDGNCNSAKTVKIISTGYADANKSSAYTQTKAYSWSTSSDGGTSGGDGNIVDAVKSAVFSNKEGSGSNFKLTATDSSNTGDIIVANGDYVCTNSGSVINGNLIILRGSLNTTSSCHVKKNVYASGTVSLSAGSVVDGDVYALGNTPNAFSMSNTGTEVKGSVYTKGSVKIDSGSVVDGNVVSTYSSTDPSKIDDATVSGDVKLASAINLGNGAKVSGNLTSSSTGGSYFYNAKVGKDFKIAGAFTQSSSDNGTIGGDLVSTGSGTNYIGPGTKVTGKIQFAGTLSTWNGGPTSSSTSTNASGLSSPSAPTFDSPDTLDLTQKQNKWIDYNFTESDWTDLGWTMVTATSSQCTQSDFDNAVSGFTENTIFDLRNCSSVSGVYGGTISLQADVTLLISPEMTGTVDLQNISFQAADSKEHILHVFVPDVTQDASPTCTSDQVINMYDSHVDDYITGFIYTPCNIQFGTSSSKIWWRGQLYAGNAEVTGGSPNLEYNQISPPGLSLDGQTSTGGGSGNGSSTGGGSGSGSGSGTESGSGTDEAATSYKVGDIISSKNG